MYIHSDIISFKDGVMDGVNKSTYAIFRHARRPYVEFTCYIMNDNIGMRTDRRTPSLSLISSSLINELVEE